MQRENASPLLPIVAAAACRSQAMTSLLKLAGALVLLLETLLGADRYGFEPAQLKMNIPASISANFIKIKLSFP